MKLHIGPDDDDLARLDDPQWVPDTPKVRSYHDKTVEVTVKGDKKGVFQMKVLETDQEGNRKAGHVLVALAPFDTDSVITTIQDLPFSTVEQINQAASSNTKPETPSPE